MGNVYNYSSVHKDFSHLYLNRITNVLETISITLFIFKHVIEPNSLLNLLKTKTKKIILLFYRRTYIHYVFFQSNIIFLHTI